LTKRALTTRLALAAASLALLALYYSISELLPNLSEPGDVLWVDFALPILIFAPVYLALGLRNRLSAVIGAILAAFLATFLYLSGETLAASIPKLAAAALVGFIFLRYCEKLWLLVAIALLAPVMDTISVWRGPTNRILTQLSLYIPAPSQPYGFLSTSVGHGGFIFWRTGSLGSPMAVLSAALLRIRRTSYANRGSSFLFDRSSGQSLAEAIAALAPIQNEEISPVYIDRMRFEMCLPTPVLRFPTRSNVWPRRKCSTKG